MKIKSVLAAILAVSVYMLPTVVSAADHVVNAKGLTAFDKPIIYIAPGDTVHFKKLNGGHNSESVFVPEGAEAWKGDMNKNISVTLTVPGFYGYICMPHAGLGMNGVIVVGDAGDKDAQMQYLRDLPQTDFARKLLGKLNKVKPESYVK
jgi:pseudoazurin